MGTGLIYAAIVAAWAAYLVPLWLRRHDEAAASRSVDRFSDAMRVLARRKAPAFTTPADDDAHGAVPSRRPVLGPPPRTVRAAPRGPSAATRRRRILVLLVAASTVLVVVAALRLVDWWTLAIPGGLIVAFLFVSALAGHAERRSAAPVARRRVAPGPPRRGTRLGASYAYGSATPSSAAGPQRGVDDEPTVLVRTAAPHVVDAAPPVEIPAAAEEGLWDPVEVPLPTYVTKARAPFTVRTVELGEPGTWTSGRLPEAELLARAPMGAAELVETVQAPPPAEEFDGEQEHRRAVGD